MTSRESRRLVLAKNVSMLLINFFNFDRSRFTSWKDISLDVIERDSKADENGKRDSFASIGNFSNPLTILAITLKGIAFND